MAFTLLALHKLSSKDFQIAIWLYKKLFKEVNFYICQVFMMHKSKIWTREFSNWEIVRKVALKHNNKFLISDFKYLLYFHSIWFILFRRVMWVVWKYYIPYLYLTHRLSFCRGCFTLQNSYKITKFRISLSINCFIQRTSDDKFSLSNFNLENNTSWERREQRQNVSNLS